jgi:tetratricopeptide (TPR) repeat protein
MKRIISVLAAILLISNYSFSQSESKDITKEADLLLDMMEYRSAIDKYLKVLSEDTRKRDIRKRIGYAYFQEKKTDDALRFLKEELELFPDNEDAYNLLIYILFKLDKLGEADIFLEEYGFPVGLTEEIPHIGGLGSFILGVYFKEARMYDSAQRYFMKAQEKGYDRVKCHTQLIDIDLVQGKSGSVKRGLVEAVKLFGHTPEFYYMSGLNYYERSIRNSDFLLNARLSFERALEINPFFRDALFNLACINYNYYKDFKKASEYFKRILEIEPENDEVRFFLDCSLKKLNKSIEKASLSECHQNINLSRQFVDNPDREYQHLFRNDINFVLENINYLGLEYIRQGKLPEAMRRFRNGLKIYPESPEINFNLGMVYFWRNDLDKAERHALVALREKNFLGRLPTYLKTQIMRKHREALRQPQKIPLSEWTFETALREGNFFLDAYDFLGSIYFTRGEFQRSVSAYRKVIEIDPGDPMGHYNLGLAYSALDDRENAESEWKDAIKYEENLERMKERGEISNDQLKISLVVLKRPVSFRAHKSLARLYLDKNLPEDALDEFLKALELEPNDPELHFEIGKIYQAKSELDKSYIKEAIFYYERYLYFGGTKETEVKEILRSLKKKE